MPNYPSGGGDFGNQPGGSPSGGGFDWSSLMSILPLLGSLFGNNNSSSILQSLQNLQGSQSQLGSYLLNMIGGLNNDFSSTFQPVMGGIGSSLLGNIGASSNNLPLSNSVFAQEASTGLSPQVQQNAMNQLLQGFQSSISDIKANATPGANTGAAMQAAQDQYLTSAANQSAQLAGESQQYKNVGAQGLASNYMSLLGLGNQFSGIGANLMDSSMSSLSNMYNSMAQQAAAYAQAATQQGQQSNPWSSIGGILGGILPIFGI